jgi:hypothetical protein
MSKHQVADLFKRHLPLARFLAARFAKTFNAPLQELIDEAEGILALVCCQWDEDYDPKRAAPSTWVYRNIYHGLLNLKTRKRHTQSLSTADGQDLLRQMPAKQNWLERLIRDLGEDARAIVQTLLDAPREIAEDLSPRRPKRAAAALRQFLVAHGWGDDKINNAWQEVSQCLATV